MIKIKELRRAQISRRSGQIRTQFSDLLGVVSWNQQDFDEEGNEVRVNTAACV